MAIWKKKKYVDLIKTKAVQFSAISSSFLFNIGIVHHFDAVNYLDTVETGSMRTPGTCSRPPASSFPGLRKAGWGPRNDATHPLDLCMAYGVLLVSSNSNAPTQAWWGQSVTSWGRSFTLWGQSVTLWSWSANSYWQPSWCVTGWGTRVDLQFESIITQPALIECRYPM